MFDMGASGLGPVGDTVPTESVKGNKTMLPAHELARLCDCLGLSGEARAIVETIRSSPPTRRVRSAAGNVSVRYPGRKMGVTIQAESHRVELAGLYEYEHDQQVLEFYDQPPAIKLIYQAKNGRQVGVWHTPDYFVLRADGLTCRCPGQAGAGPALSRPGNRQRLRVGLQSQRFRQQRRGQDASAIGGS